MEDMAPELLQTIRLAWQKALISDAELRSLTKRITEGKATYKEVEDIAYRVGKDLSKALVGNITSDIMPDGHVPQNVAEKILQPTLREAHAMVIEAATKTQEAMNKAAGIGLKAQAAEFDAEKAQGLVYKLTNGLLEDTGWILDAPVTSFVQSSADRTLKKNVDFQARAGLHPIITREAEGKCCKWCSNLEGSYEYGDEPKDIYRRHRRCRCVVDYRPGNGKRQNVWSKSWHEDAQPEKMEERIKRNEIITRKNEQKKLAQRKMSAKGMGRIEPIFNTREEIQDLCDYAHSLGIRIIRPDKLNGDISMAKEQIAMVAKYSKEYGIIPPAVRFEAMDLEVLGTTSKKATSIAIQNNALRKRVLTNEYLNSDNQLAATDARGIAVHEIGHVLCKKYGDVGIEIARETLYNINKEEISDNDILSFLSGNVSGYSLMEGETIPEILSKNETNPDEFTITFVKLLKKRWGL